MISGAPLNPDWLAIARETPYSYRSIHEFAVYCRALRVTVPEPPAIRQMILVSLATGGSAFDAYIEMQLSARNTARQVDPHQDRGMYG